MQLLLTCDCNRNCNGLLLSLFLPFCCQWQWLNDAFFLCFCIIEEYSRGCVHTNHEYNGTTNICLYKICSFPNYWRSISYFVVFIWVDSLVVDLLEPPLRRWQELERRTPELTKHSRCCSIPCSLLLSYLYLHTHSPQAINQTCFHAGQSGNTARFWRTLKECCKAQSHSSCCVEMHGMH